MFAFSTSGYSTVSIVRGRKMSLAHCVVSTKNRDGDDNRTPNPIHNEPEPDDPDPEDETHELVTPLKV
jgi:hypothetical protein